jgi:AcrR family transcriptional regulator
LATCAIRSNKIEIVSGSAKRPKTRTSGGANALRAAGLALFAEFGFEGASTHAIAERARLPQGLVRYHFGSKEGLWRDVMAAGAIELATDLSAGVRGSEPIEHVLPFAATAHQRFVQAIGHALLEPGARRDWLIAELASQLQPHVRAWLASASRGRPPSQDDEVMSLMWLAAALAMAAFAPALERARGAALDHDRALRVQRDLLGAWLARERAPEAFGPWSIAAAAARRKLRASGTR